MRPTLTLSAVLLMTPFLASATPLTGASGTFSLPAISGPPSLIPGVAGTIAAVGPNHTVTWASPAASHWVGTYNGTGPFPASASNSPASWDFTPLPLGYLPTTTYAVFGDLDSGELLTLIARDPSGNVITTHWLTDLIFFSDSNPTNYTAALMPSWTFNSVTGEYRITGELVPRNPLTTLVAQTAQAISRIDLTKDSSFGFSLRANTVNPVPEPASLGMIGAGLIAAGLLRQWRVRGSN